MVYLYQKQTKKPLKGRYKDMMTMINNLGNRMVTLMRVINIDGFHSENNAKFRHELNGMTMALKAMEIEFDFDYNYEVTQYTAVIIMGTRFEVEK